MWLKHRVKIRLVTGMLREGIDCIPSRREHHDEICLLTDSLTNQVLCPALAVSLTCPPHQLRRQMSGPLRMREGLPPPSGLPAGRRLPRGLHSVRHEALESESQAGRG